MSNGKQVNKVTSHLSEDEKQQLYKNARAKDWYGGIWQNVGKCVFCDLKDKYILHEENGVVLTINLYPYIDGQMMVIPRKHVSSTKQLTDLEWETMRKLSYLRKKLQKKVHGHKAMWNLIREGGEAGQMTVSDHLHMQLIPFDAKDLCVWNFRDLNYTPLENVALYKKEFKEFIEDKYKFEKKYSTKNALPVVCDVIIKNKKGEVLLQERKEEYKFHPDYLTLPGGHIDDFTKPFEESLQREVLEEIGLEIKVANLKLLASRTSALNYVSFSKHLNKKMVSYKQFVWNTYVLNIEVENMNLKAGDDCKGIKWLSLEDIKQEKRLSDPLKETLIQHLSKIN